MAGDHLVAAHCRSTYIILIILTIIVIVIVIITYYLKVTSCPQKGGE